MKKLIPLIIFLPFLQAKAQTSVYHPFPDSNAVWNVYAYSCCWAANCPPPPTPNPVLMDSYYTYFIKGDTLVNGTLYHKIYKNGYSHEHCNFGNTVNNWFYYDSVYTGAYREDTLTKTVYFLFANNSSECLLYDFDLNVGDTIKDACQISLWGTVSSIDSILIDSNYRKRINFSSFQSLIEGIGTTSGLIEPFFSLEIGATLLCFKQNNQILYPDTATTCDLITASGEIENPVKDLKIFPNPASAELNINFIIDKQSFVELHLFNSLGEKIKVFTEGNIKQGENRINFSAEDIPKGIYFLRIKIDENEITKKIVKL